MIAYAATYHIQPSAQIVRLHPFAIANSTTSRYTHNNRKRRDHPVAPLAGLCD
jgi:hypothetical protein